MKKIIMIGLVSFLFLIGCNQSKTSESVKEISDVTQFSPKGSGNYLLFHLIDPFGKKGYINEVDSSAKVLKKHTITDNHFSPSDVFHFQDQFYFASGAYSNETQVMKYNPSNKKISLIETGQNKFIEKYYKDDVSEYVITVVNKDDSNDVCDIKKKKCVNLSQGYIAQDITSINNHIIVVGVDNKSMESKEKVTVIKKYDRSLNLIKEITLDILPNYFTFTHQAQKLYLFMINGDITEVDSELNIKTYPIDLSKFSQKIARVNYNKNVVIDKDTILLNLEIRELEKKLSSLVKISFKNHTPHLEEIDNSKGESVLNIDQKSNEIFTRSYENKRTIIKIRDLKTLKVTNTLKLENNDPIYFVDNIK
ncbi:hypothetical protein [Bacillus pseudomycoides]|uniref:hypothetical protein n=1 Tax=Bacillus pseudomycoides TaxID=64104 RepID=UPI000BF01D98|nr:hypothetical protein [Bacillus pseudomycoides]PEO40885.1 hypothetical protein CN559_28235 [Bacillus pseudomycoides]